jgi:hypothetical protein
MSQRAGQFGFIKPFQEARGVVYCEFLTNAKRQGARDWNFLTNANSQGPQAL